MNRETTPSIGLRIGSLIVATFSGVVVVIALWQLRAIASFEQLSFYGIWRTLDQILFSLVVGWLIALPFCLMIGLPLWHLAIRSDRQTRRDALRFGFIAGGCIGLVMAIIGDTTAGWFGELLDLLGYCFAGMAAGSIAHRAAYRPE